MQAAHANGHRVGTSVEKKASSLSLLPAPLTGRGHGDLQMYNMPRRNVRRTKAISVRRCPGVGKWCREWHVVRYGRLVFIVLVIFAIVSLVVLRCGGAFARFLILFTSCGIGCFGMWHRSRVVAALPPRLISGRHHNRRYCHVELHAGTHCLLCCYCDDCRCRCRLYFGVLRIFTFRVGLFSRHNSGVKLV